MSFSVWNLFVNMYCLGFIGIHKYNNFHVKSAIVYNYIVVLYFITVFNNKTHALTENGFMDKYK